MTPLISAAQLAALAPNCDAEVIAPALSAASSDRQINTPLRLAHFLGQISAESGGFVRLVENLNYSAERLMVVWPSRFPTLASANNCAHNPDALAVRVYFGRNGNITPADARTFIGRGFIQLTGRTTYSLYAAKLGVDLIGHPELAAVPAVAARIAAAFWADRGLNELADLDSLEAITRAINGGLTNLPDRRAAVAKAKAIFGVRAA